MVADHLYDIANERINRLHFIRSMSIERGYNIETIPPPPPTGHVELAEYADRLLKTIDAAYKFKYDTIDHS